MKGEQIRKLRIAAGLNQKQLAVKLKVTKQAISSWESGKSLPSVTALISLADYFGCTTDFILGRNNSSYYIPTQSLSDEEAQAILKLVNILEQSHNIEKGHQAAAFLNGLSD